MTCKTSVQLYVSIIIIIKLILWEMGRGKLKVAKLGCPLLSQGGVECWHGGSSASVCVCVCVCMCACVCVRVCVCVLCACVHLHARMFMHVHVCVYMCVCVKERGGKGWPEKFRIHIIKLISKLKESPYVFGTLHTNYSLFALTLPLLSCYNLFYYYYH